MLTKLINDNKITRFGLFTIDKDNSMLTKKFPSLFSLVAISLAGFMAAPSAQSFARDLPGNVIYLPQALQVPAVRSFILRNPRQIDSLGMVGIGCGGDGPVCGEAVKGKANWAITLRISFLDPSHPRMHCRVKLDVFATKYPDDSLEFTGEVRVDELNSDKGCAH